LFVGSDDLREIVDAFIPSFLGVWFICFMTFFSQESSASIQAEKFLGQPRLCACKPFTGLQKQT
jgi:hypothetical protein